MNKVFIIIIYFVASTNNLSFAQIKPKQMSDYDLAINNKSSDRVGNGGDVIVCNGYYKDDGSTELLDFYELRTVHGLKTRLDTNKSLDQNLEILIDRLGHFDDVIQKKVQAFYENFINEAFFIDDSCLVDIPDSNHLTLPPNCGIFQIAIQSEPDWKNKNYRYIIDRTLWDQLDEVNRAGLALHEMIYRVAIENKNIKDSRSTRLLVNLVVADNLKNLSRKEYVKFISTEFGIKYPTDKSF